MKKTIAAILTIATLITSAAAVSAAEVTCRCMGCQTEICATEDCPNNGVPVKDGTGLHRRGGGHHRGQKSHEYCPYR